MKLTYNDSNHSYFLEGKRCKSVTTIAKIPDDTYSLDQWRKRMVVMGLALTPALVERAAAHYDDRDQLGRIAEEAMTAAKAHEASGRGTAAHRIAERHDLDQMIVDTPFARAVRNAWQKALDGAGLDIVPEYIERIVVYPDLKIAGRFDRIARRRSDGRLVMLDLKTGANAAKYPHAIAVQLALYVNAQYLAGPIPNEGGSTEEFTKLPTDLDRKWGVIVHMPTDDTVEVHKVNIEAGWDIARNVVFPILKWRARRDLTKTVGSTLVADPSGEAPSERVDWLRGRLSLIGMVDGARDVVASRWPLGVAPRGPWSDADIDELDTMLVTVEADASAGFPTRDPALADVKAI